MCADGVEGDVLLIKLDQYVCSVCLVVFHYTSLYHSYSMVVLSE